MFGHSATWFKQLFWIPYYVNNISSILSGEYLLSQIFSHDVNNRKVGICRGKNENLEASQYMAFDHCHDVMK
jgi:hypothetical protein